MIYLDIETLDFFHDEHIKHLPRPDQLNAIRFGFAATCRLPPPGQQLYLIHNLKYIEGDPVVGAVYVYHNGEIITPAPDSDHALLSAIGHYRAVDTTDTTVTPIADHWQIFHAPDIVHLYHYLCLTGEPLIGWNITSFDWPIILNSTRQAGHHPLEIELESVIIVDLFDMIRTTTGRWYSLEAVAQANLGRGKLATGQQATDWLRSADPAHLDQAVNYCRADVQLVIDLHAKLLSGDYLILPPRPERQEINAIHWRPAAHERIPDPLGAISTR